MVVLDGVPEKEVAMGWVKIRPIKRGLHSGEGMVSCKRKHGIATEVRDTNLRFSMTTTTPTNRCQKSEWRARKSDPNPSQATLDGANKSRTHVATCAFHSSQIALLIINRLFCRKQY